MCPADCGMYIGNTIIEFEKHFILCPNTYDIEEDENKRELVE